MNYKKSLFIFILVLCFVIVCLSCSDMIGYYLDSAAGTIVINNDAPFTFSESVTLNIDVVDASKMRFSNDGSNWSTWENYTTTKSWTLTVGHTGKTVFGEFLHSNGNILKVNDIITPLIEEKITASDGVGGDYFGGFQPSAHGSPLSISLDGNAVVVGSWWGNNHQGSAYVYKWNGNSWIETKLIASDGVAGDRFGFSVSVSYNGNIIVVGSWWDNNRQGSAYVYRYNGISWNETNITSSDGEVNNEFGVSVSISGDGNTIIVGAYHDDPGGSAYIYKWDGNSWDETKITTPADCGGSFGFHVAISSDGNTVVVGTPFDTGFMYIYKWDGNSWIETKLTASDGESGDYFGRIVSVSDSGNTVLTGAYCDDIGANTEQGSAYIYKWSGNSWIETKLIASDGESGDSFGYSASISSDGDTIIIGAICDHIGINWDQGSVYIYRWNGSTWDETKLIASDGESNDWFGYSAYVSSDGNTFASWSAWR